LRRASHETADPCSTGHSDCSRRLHRIDPDEFDPRSNRFGSRETSRVQVKVWRLAAHIPNDVDDVGVIQTEAIEHAYRTNRERLWRALLAYTGEPEAASDALAETVARALASPTEIGDAAAWLWRVAFRVATADLRSKRSSVERPEGSYELSEDVVNVLLALKHLTPKQRSTFVLFYLDDRPTEEIGRLLGLSASTVSVHLHRARKRLRSILEVDDA
jgi:RNA polymerase sigma factor (sigma-70 family)